ncbi:MAG: hypothetical protein LBT03_02630 [Holosporales bacterium]|jgi:hypothetical protein|nr:hypothetical protein [Holosporales bacterium]
MVKPLCLLIFTLTGSAIAGAVSAEWGFSSWIEFMDSLLYEIDNESAEFKDITDYINDAKNSLNVIVAKQKSSATDDELVALVDAFNEKIQAIRDQYEKMKIKPGKILQKWRAPDMLVLSDRGGASCKRKRRVLGDCPNKVLEVVETKREETLTPIPTKEEH